MDLGHEREARDRAGNWLLPIPYYTDNFGRKTNSLLLIVASLLLMLAASFFKRRYLLFPHFGPVYFENQ